MATLLIDNHDSYTYNLFQLIARVNGVEPIVLMNDDQGLLHLDPSIDCVVISPGPGRPQRARDVGHTPRLLRDVRVPVLGVCLGHQVLAYVAGASVAPLSSPLHGHTSMIRHDGRGLFDGVPQGFLAVRYHSLSVVEPLPETLIATAWTQDGVLMAVRHRARPWWGVQFHPESIGTEHGFEIISNFMALSREWGTSTTSRTPRRAVGAPPERPARKIGATPLKVLHAKITRNLDAESVFRGIFAESNPNFWLDSSLVEEGLARFSFLGNGEGPMSETLSFDVDATTVTLCDSSGERSIEGDIFSVLATRLEEKTIEATELPFDFVGGYVGYFGYELKNLVAPPPRRSADTPDAVWMFVDRLVAVDHHCGEIYVVAVHPDSPDARESAAQWVSTVVRQITDMPPARDELVDSLELDAMASDYLLGDRGTYLHQIEECQQRLLAGESYEICLTTRFRSTFSGDPFDLYRYLRRVNPAPYSAFLRFSELSICCSSPERFMRISPQGRVESRPIKGTARRDSDPDIDRGLANGLRTDVKTRAENLMIVDLVRNDFGKVCEIGSVVVDEYMSVRSYATMHQLMSVISGRLRGSISPVECVRECFPGGSMTGAPKERTMEILDELENEVRGVYSGAMGYFGLNGGCDLNIAIRLAVINKDESVIGAGGAIVLDSDAQEEFDEMMLKASTITRALRHLDREVETR